MAFKVIFALLFVAHLAAGFTNCHKSRWAELDSDITKYNDQNIENFGLLGVSRDEVIFRLWTRSQKNNYSPIYYKHLENEETFRLDKPFKIVIHGWSDCADSKWYEYFKDEYLKKGDYNVILVDWTKPAGALYPLSAGYTKDVGKYVGELIVDLNQTMRVPLENIHLIGHSLGSHISGFAGKYVQNNTPYTVGRITGMDPAGPLFLLATAPNRLSHGDALFVDVIHTDGGKFGYSNVLGHADFYPNGGDAPQTGCIITYNLADVASCSHTRSYWIFGESINSEEFVSNECASYKKYKAGDCTENLQAVMGENIEIGVKGVFYLNTFGKSPYAKNGAL